MKSLNDTINVLLEDGTSIQIESMRPVRQQVSTTSSKSISKVMHTVTALAKEMKSSFELTNSRKTIIEIGLDITLESGDLTALIVKGSSTANFKITFEWEKNFNFSNEK